MAKRFREKRGEKKKFLPYCYQFAGGCWVRVAPDRKAEVYSLCARGSCMRCQWNPAFSRWRCLTRRWGSLDNPVLGESFSWFRPTSRSVSTRKTPCCCPNPLAVDSENIITEIRYSPSRWWPDLRTNLIFQIFNFPLHENNEIFDLWCFWCVIIFSPSITLIFLFI